MKDNLSQKNSWKFDTFCIFRKDEFSFSYKYDITFLSKKERWSSSKKYILKDDISGITEKVYIHPRKCGISSDRKTKDDKKVYFYKNVII